MTQKDALASLDMTASSYVIRRYMVSPDISLHKNRYSERTNILHVCFNQLYTL
jgi:hypothetical protein